MNELEVIDRIRRRLGRGRRPGLVLGIGDDCAIFRPPDSRHDLLFTTDLFLEDRHFRRTTHPAAAVGYKALARGLSDIAAMGGEPRFCLLSLAVPTWADEKWIEGFYRGFLRLARRSGTTLAGGDLARHQRLACDVVVGGVVPKGKALRRDGARPGDVIYVSGRLGGSALGMRTQRGQAWKRHLEPEPRLELGRFLRESLATTAAMDISDGLALDLHRMCLESGVSASLEAEIPLFSGATVEQALHGGEDFELLFTVRQGSLPPPHYNGIPLTRLGTIRKGRAGEMEYLGRPLAPVGYDHFKAS